ncbi:cell division protein FtsL [Candidatus Pelagibacter sp.]|nr:cell division protein FtsL [Candidatus Pelagibacter sp.]MDA9682057.1 cell division protein FtsL [Candidatus Pelagibacter sp.]
MKKIVLTLSIFILILSTAIIKNSAKKTEDEIFTVKENLRVLRSEFEKVKLEHDYLSSSEKLLEFQSEYFEDELIQKSIENIKVFRIQNNDKKILNLKVITEQ